MYQMQPINIILYFQVRVRNILIADPATATTTTTTPTPPFITTCATTTKASLPAVESVELRWYQVQEVCKLARERVS
jgi:hypothetical protein